MPTPDPRVDRYIAEAASFAQPLLTHFRQLVHKSNPEIEEAIKWSMPFFVFRGSNVCHMAAFKAHCGFGFWRKEIQQDISRKHPSTTEGMGSFGRITKSADMPSDREVAKYIRQSCDLIADGTSRAGPTNRKPRPALEMPSDLDAALRKDAKARKVFEEFAPSHRRDYIEWITEAKRPETRADRLATIVGWLREGKPRHWKYQR